MDVGRLRASAPLIAIAAATALVVSGGSGDDPRTPPALPGLPAPFLGSAVIGNGGLTAAIDAYGNIVDVRFPGPAGEAQVDNPLARQQAGSVPHDTGVVVAGGAGQLPLPLWRASVVKQRYLRGTNVLRTAARVGRARLSIVDGVRPGKPELLRVLSIRGGRDEELRVRLTLTLDRTARRCAFRPAPDHETSDQDDEGRRLVWRGRGELRIALACQFGGDHAAPISFPAAGLRDAAHADRRWLGRARPLGAGVPRWAERMYRRSLLVLRALVDRRSGAIAAGVRDRWAFVWPRDAAAGAIALADAGYRPVARRVVGFLEGLPLESAARFRGDRSAVDDGREIPGDARGWVAAAARSAALPAPDAEAGWRDRGDYGEREDDRGDYLANAIASSVRAARIRRLFGTAAGLVRRAGDPRSGWDSAAAWAVRPFPRPALFGLLRAELTSLAREAGPFGLVPAERWPGSFPWTAPTAWTAWSLAALGERREALRLLGSLRRAANGAGLLPERVSDLEGVADSTTPLGWSHAFALLALRELWPASG